MIKNGKIPKKTQKPKTEINDLKVIEDVRNQLSIYEKVKQFFKQFNLF
jgi:hypothetical protein